MRQMVQGRCRGTPRRPRPIDPDGLKSHLDAVEGDFDADVDYAQLIKIEGAPDSAKGQPRPAEGAGINRDANRGKARAGAYFDVTRGTRRSHAAHGDAPFH